MPNIPRKAPPRPWIPIREAQSGRKKERSKEYSSRKWTKYSILYRKLNPICGDCGAFSQVVDHIVPVNAGGVFYDPKNHQALCNQCHNRKSATTDKEHNK